MPVALRVLTAAQPHIAPLAATTDAAAKAVIDEALHAAAGVDGDRCLDAFEAEAVGAAFAQVKPQGGALTLGEAQQVRSALDVRLAALKDARPKTTDVVFTSTGNATTVFRAKILGAIDDTISKANGKPVDVNLMMFAFTDDVLGDALIARCRANPNVTVRLLTDWSGLADSGGREGPRLARLAAREPLPNLQVKFKKDMPYTWDAARAGPSYNHGATTGLNHHKGFVTLVDGRPEKMTLGSFNWSEQAMSQNLENLMILDRGDADNRAVMSSYQKEVESFWNDPNSALSYRDALIAREDAYEKLHRDNGAAYTRKNISEPAVVLPAHNAVDNTAFVDINSFSAKDAARLEQLIGKTAATKIWTELSNNGRFDSLAELQERVPSLATLSSTKKTALTAAIEFGDGGLSVNTATAAELDRAGFSAAQASKLVAYRTKHGALESLDEVVKASGIAKSRLEKISISLSDDEARGYYSARPLGATAPTTGWSADNRAPVNVPRRPELQTIDANAPLNRAQLEQMDANLAAGVIDMLRRAPAGATFSMAMYGLSPNSPEFAEIDAAAKRGVKVRAVLYKAYNQPAIDALKALKAAGHDVDLRVISSRVMHEKIGVVGDDSFNGSANMSMSSITKHSEDRFVFRNMPDLADQFRAEIDRLWAMGRVP
jgi:competence ComEA-like helix-hairpin-helix protein